MKSVKPIPVVGSRGFGRKPSVKGPSKGASKPEHKGIALVYRIIFGVTLSRGRCASVPFCSRFDLLPIVSLFARSCCWPTYPDATRINNHHGTQRSSGLLSPQSPSSSQAIQFLVWHDAGRRVCSFDASFVAKLRQVLRLGASRHCPAIASHQKKPPPQERGASRLPGGSIPQHGFEVVQRGCSTSFSPQSQLRETNERLFLH